MNKNQKNFMMISMIAVLIAFGITFAYHKYQDKKLDKNIELFTNTLVGKEEKKEKGILTKLKESIFGPEEEKISKKLDKKLEELAEIENKYTIEEDKNKKEKLSEEYKKLSEEIVILQDKYYSLAGVDYEPKDKKDAKDLLDKTDKKSEATNPKDIFREELKKEYIDKNYSLKNTSLFQKLKNLFGANKIDSFVKENQKITITYEEERAVVEEFIDDKLVKSIEYKTEDNYATIQVKMEDKEKEFTRTLENIKSGFGVDKFKDGTIIEFNHNLKIPDGPALRYFSNGDREEFIYRNGKKHGFSTYYFSNGDKEEVYYIDDILEGKAKYTYADGYVETYIYKDGKRVE